MTQEEAIKILKDFHDKSALFSVRTALETLHPELKESEDERIRKEIIAWLKNSEGQTLPIDRYNAALAWLEKQGEQKQEINNFDVLPGLYKCVHRMFDGTPDGRLLFEVGNVYRCLSKHDRAEFEVSYGHSVYLEDPVVCKHFIPFEKRGEVESDNDDIEVEEKGIREAFNKIEDEKQCKQKPQRMISAEAKEALYDKPAWSEEDERTIHNIDAAIRHEVVFPINELKSMEIWLESLKYRIRPKHEWKRDEKMFQLIEDVIDVYRKTQGSVVGGIHTEELKDFLNCIASKQDWKPSDEQMTTLYKYAEQNNYDGSILTSLYNDLKKLREE